MVSPAGSFEVRFSGGKTTISGQVCTEMGTDAKACVGGSLSTQQEGNQSITGRQVFGSLETGSVKLTISDEQRTINPIDNTTDEFGIMKPPKSGNTYIVHIKKGKASFFRVNNLPDAAGGKYKFELAEGGQAVVVSNAKGERQIGQLSTTHE
jgi:hypothetical protein